MFGLNPNCKCDFASAFCSFNNIIIKGTKCAYEIASLIIVKENIYYTFLTIIKHLQRICSGKRVILSMKLYKIINVGEVYVVYNYVLVTYYRLNREICNRAKEHV